MERWSKNSDMRVSVIMSVYKEPLKILDKAVNSILGQTYKEYEFIIVNDNPEENENKKYLQRLAEKEKNVILLENEDNIGLANSLNRAIENATGEYIVRMDADDIALPNRIECQLNCMEKEDYDILGSYISCIDIDDNIVRKGIRQPCSCDAVQYNLRYRDCLFHPTWMVKKEAYKKLNGYRNILACEDYDFLLRAANLKMRLANIDEILLFYRINSKSISNKMTFRQYVTSYFLQKNRNTIEEISVQEIESYVNCILENSQSIKRFRNAQKYNELAILSRDHKQYISEIKYIILASFTSFYFRKQYINMIKMKICMNLWRKK